MKMQVQFTDRYIGCKRFRVAYLNLYSHGMLVRSIRISLAAARALRDEGVPSEG